MDKLVKGLELRKCDYLNEPGRWEAVRELIKEYTNIFMDEEKKIGMVPNRYHTTIKLKPGTMPIKQKLRPMQPQQQVELKVQLKNG